MVCGKHCICYSNMYVSVWCCIDSIGQVTSCLVKTFNMTELSQSTADTNSVIINH